MQIYIFRRMVTHFAHVRKLGMDFDCGPGDAPIHEILAKIHRDAMNHPEGELKMARKAREQVRLLETRGEEYDNSDGGVKLPLHQPKLKGWAEHSSRSRSLGLEYTHDPVVWREDAQQRSDFLFPCAAHPLDRCQDIEDCIFGTFTPGRLRQEPEEWEPTDKDDMRELEEWQAAQTNGEAQELDDDDEYDDRPASYPSFSPWLDPEGLLAEDEEEGE
ncbi:hypothetical protein BC567DRAFT_217910 [Phyllosticta citribraziliensis]